MASPGNQHFTNFIGTLSFAMSNACLFMVLFSVFFAGCVQATDLDRDLYGTITYSILTSNDT